MYTYNVWFRTNQYQTANAQIRADNDNQAFMIAEAQFGKGNVLNYTRVD